MTRSLSLIYLTIIFALILTISPMPDVLAPYRPDWALMAIVYWSIALPHRVNVLTAWITGLMLDLLLGSVLGVNGLIFTIIAYVAASNFKRIRNFSVWQQAIIVGMLSAFYHLTEYWLVFILTDSYFFPSLMWPTVTTAVMWPWAFLLLRKIRRGFKIS
ncbi:rod shape-determining protein MreD [Saccharobesus litoralis]|uniref:Rod shape-determining protein MreD n=1 Tax=Saccharobesus litoralis TaxID=2172099 RepID=A0A2S0VX70_9ALTE|nr:rod shape-determining protein MreD [Saccharobesus litoralis]AWB68804.1 rod shape-determining protein MreD [Saccharobesus litoralis]